MKQIVCIISLIACTLCASAQVFVESKIDSIEILIGEQTDIALSVTAKKGSKIKLPTYKPSQYITPGVEVLDNSIPDTAQLDNGLIKITRRYTLTSFDENLYYLPPMKVNVDGKEYKSKSLALKVLTVPVDTLHPEKFYPPKGVQDNPFQWSEWEGAFWLSVIFVLICVLTYYLWTRLKENKPVIYGDIKNQPLVYIKKTEPDVLVIVNTTEDVKKHTIDYNRDKIILSIIITMLTVFFVVGLYTYYLYINIRQLFKAIIAISKGNYERRIRLLTNIFTPFEIVFLGNEFNRMVNQIHKSYIQLKKKNKELKQVNEFRSNMIDTVSHEFRTPLTSIQGYTSRLLRQDIEIDEETRIKSLKTIKRQAERLKRMIEDLLVIPDIEGARLNFNMQNVPINSIIESSIMLVRNDSGKEIVNNIKECQIEVFADMDRLEQVFVNLIENAIKYSKGDSPIILDYEIDRERLVVSVKNDYDVIPREKLKTLFDKFTRVDDTTTRTTRGTGLGLFIVKGLVEAMGGEIRLYSNEECGFCVKVFMPIANGEA